MDENTSDSANEDEGNESRKVPLEALEAERTLRQASDDRNRVLERETAELRGRVDGLSASREEVKEMTRTEITAALQNDQITQAEADRMLDDQATRRAETIARETAEKTVETATRKGMLTEEVKRYTDLVPEVLTEGSDARAKVQQEYNYLTALGQPATLETELMALRSVYGPPDRLSSTARKARETHQEIGNGEDTEETGSSKWPKGMNKRFKDHYKGQVDSGRITMDAALLEIKEASPRPQARMGLA